MFQRKPSYPLTHGLRNLNETLKKAVEEAEAACGTGQVERQLERVSNLFDNCIMLRDAIYRGNKALSVALKQKDQAEEAGSEMRVQHNATLVERERQRLADYEEKLQLMEDYLCEYVAKHKKAESAGDKEQVLFNKAIIEMWNALCANEGLECKEHGAEAIYARRVLKQEVKSESKDHKDQSESTSQSSYPLTYNLRMSNASLKKDVEEAEAACGKDQVELQLKRISTIFDNYMILLKTINNGMGFWVAQSQVDDCREKLQLMKKALCEYVDRHNKALSAGVKEQVILNKAIIKMWDALCANEGLEYKEHGAETIYARHALEADKKHESKSKLR